MKIDSKKNISKAKAKSQSPVTKPKPHWLNIPDHQSTKDCAAFQHGHTQIILAEDVQKMLAKQKNDEKLAITILIISTGIIPYHI